MIKAIIFDLDGVLRDAEWINVITAVQAFEKIGIKIKKEEEELIIGRHMADYHKDFKKLYDYDEKEYDKIKYELYYSMLKKAKLFPHAIEILKKLKNNFRLALVTSSEKTGVYDEFINKYELQEVFDVIVTFEDIKNRKPAPDSYLKALEKLDLGPEECVVIEDTEVGVEASKKASIKCIAILAELTKNEDFSKADIILQSLKEITLELLEGLA